MITNATNVIAENVSTLSYLKDDLAPNVIARLLELLTAPKQNPDMIWMVSPLIVTVLLMTFYFGKYGTEDIGWNTAVGNNLVLLFVSVDLLRQIYNGLGNGVVGATIMNYEMYPIKTALSLVILFIALILLFLNFLHAIPKRISFFLSSPLPINLTAYIAMAIVYTNVVFDGTTVIAGLVLFFILLGIIQLLKFIERLVLEWSSGKGSILPKTYTHQHEGDMAKEAVVEKSSDKEKKPEKEEKKVENKKKEKEEKKK
ncbi:MAG: hypothetical protein U9R34_08755 [Nanoarchaeota archaeon]|nr:hypothetical protein [Nanoarchaeota archaeon]